MLILVEIYEFVEKNMHAKNCASIQQLSRFVFAEKEQGVERKIDCVRHGRACCAFQSMLTGLGPRDMQDVGQQG